MFRPGEMDQLITIQRETLADDGYGGQTVTLTNVATDLFCHVRPRSGKEGEEYQRLNAEATYMFVIRYRDDLREDDRIIWNGVQYNIRTILGRGGRSMYLEIDATRGVAL